MILILSALKRLLEALMTIFSILGNSVIAFVACILDRPFKKQSHVLTKWIRLFASMKIKKQLCSWKYTK